jgi:hypothetical protein
MLTGNRFLLLGAITASASFFWSYKAIANGLSIIFPVPILLACFVLSAFAGIGVTSLAEEQRRFRWLALGAAIFIGILIMYGAYLILSLLAGPT